VTSRRRRAARETSYRDLPAYPLAEVARYIRVAPATLRSWVVGREYAKRSGAGFFEPLIAPANPQGPLLSFSNLVEAHVLRALRIDHSVSIADVRSALTYAQRELGIPRVLLSQKLRTHAGEVLLERYGQLINLSRSGQLAMRKVLEAHLRRVMWAEPDVPIRLYPFMASAETGERAPAVAIDPTIAFGRPVVFRRGVSTAAIVERLDAGESVDELAEDYGLERDEIEQAALYERAA
jgi:uncharacterized protein (DUF433 family)